MQNPLRSFTQYLKEEEEITSDAPLKGYTGEQVISRIEELMQVFSDSLKFGVPSDMLGRATTYRDANGAIEKIKDVQHYYESSGEDVMFYCWSISYRGSWDATTNLKKKINSSGGFGEETNMSLKKIIAYFTDNREDADNVRSISISLDSKEKRKALKNKETRYEEPREEF
jgi:hypothetical protein